MTEQQDHAHGAHVGPDVQAPGPSIWPFATGIAALLVGLALIWWSRDTGDNVAAVFLGQAIIVGLVALGAWIYEDTRSGRYARAHGTDEARYTQILTFAVPEGQLDAARADGGVVGAIESRDSALRALQGFQDLRIVVSPADVGASQVLVETAWANREGLASYDETRQTLLDIVNDHPTHVEVGTVQVLDMEVIRDTKEIPVRLGLGTAATVVGALVIGGFFVGAGLTLFEEEGAGGGGGNGGPPAFSGTIVAKDIKFVETAFKLPPNAEVTLTLDNQDAGTLHNIVFANGPEHGGDALQGCLEGCENPPSVSTVLTAGPVQQPFTFTTPGPGTYAYWCAAHPTQMRGILTVEEGAPLPGEAGGGGVSTEVTVVATDNAFDVTEISFPANTDVTITLDNQGVVPHNIEVWDSPTVGQGALLQTCIEGCGAPPAAGTSIAAGPVVQVLKFTTPGPGTYAYQCIVHQTEMKGVITVQ
jgi:plastocyanin